MEKLAEIRYKAYQQFYLRPGYVFHMMRKGGTYGISAVKNFRCLLAQGFARETLLTFLLAQLKQKPAPPH